MNNVKPKTNRTKLSFEYFSTISPVSFADNEQTPSKNQFEECIFSIDVGYPSEQLGRFFKAQNPNTFQQEIFFQT